MVKLINVKIFESCVAGEVINAETGEHVCNEIIMDESVIRKFREATNDSKLWEKLTVIDCSVEEYLEPSKIARLYAKRPIPKKELNHLFK